MSLIIDSRTLRVRLSIAGRGIGLDMLPNVEAEDMLARDGVEAPLIVWKLIGPSFDCSVNGRSVGVPRGGGTR
jgi:hypothetical protein